MNIRLFSMALLVSAIPSLSSADKSLSFQHGDFIAKERGSRNGDKVVQFKLSKSGKAKLKKLP